MVFQVYKRRKTSHASDTLGHDESRDMGLPASSDQDGDPSYNVAIHQTGGSPTCEGSENGVTKQAPEGEEEAGGEINLLIRR